MSGLQVKFPSRNCSDGKIEAFLPGRVQAFLTVCGDNETALRTLPLLTAKELMPPGGTAVHEPSVTIHFTSQTTPARTAFKIAWTELHHLPRNSDGTLMTSKLQGGQPELEPQSPVQRELDRQVQLQQELEQRQRLQQKKRGASGSHAQ